jgi:hypothetical protein
MCAMPIPADESREKLRVMMTADIISFLERYVVARGGASNPAHETRLLVEGLVDVIVKLHLDAINHAIVMGATVSSRIAPSGDEPPEA